MNQPLVSVIIPTHNSEKTIKQCVNSLLTQSISRENYEIIIVDDGSTDKTLEIAKNKVDNVIITEPCFQGKARNIGVKNSKSSFLAFVDSDCAVSENWIKTIIDELKQASVITGPVGNGNAESLVAWGEWFIEFGEYDEHKKRSIVRMFPGCNGACKKEDYQNVGGFNESESNEDALFGANLKKIGLTVSFIPEMKINHLCRTDLHKVKANMRKLGRLFVKTRRANPSMTYSSLAKSKKLIPAIFFGKLFLNSKYAINAKKFTKFLMAYPYVVSGIFSFCRGIWNELDKKTA